MSTQGPKELGRCEGGSPSEAVPFCSFNFPGSLVCLSLKVCLLVTLKLTWWLPALGPGTNLELGA